MSVIPVADGSTKNIKIAVIINNKSAHKSFSCMKVWPGIVAPRRGEGAEGNLGRGDAREGGPYLSARHLPLVGLRGNLLIVIITTESIHLDTQLRVLGPGAGAQYPK